MTDATIRIYDVNGRMIKEMPHLNGTDYVLLRDHLEARLYFLQIADENGVFSSVKLTVTD